ncbi:peptide-methionine (R)-S-oxide reductase MsrB [Salinisphaera sp. LB1]|uniref:peptide-methionine (R)-S-oxide reductase MsrB n=1 Tax=Salinisphaera sp. LB1 TaxID=2183911 RepID=UPI000D705477|nr:peptide-methionine (R)-S-oxide reductase MsrB [Salinisphaera sp. LB1]AWN16427.1 Peptide methionine sulfoxide reductase MsrB [Salinisphaera sp. LB1]
MNQRINNPRRRFLIGASTVFGAGLLVGLTRWLPASAAGDSQAGTEATGPVTIVAFDDHGKRLGRRTVPRVVKTPAQWRAELTPAQYHILREHGTERPFTGRYYNPPEQQGIYRCQGCGNALYDSATQFHSGTGWPSFYQPIAAENVTEHTDHSFGMTRTEIACTECAGHLGHKFHDGPKPTGLRYCMDSVALRFIPTGAA